MCDASPHPAAMQSARASRAAEHCACSISLCLRWSAVLGPGHPTCTTYTTPRHQCSSGDLPGYAKLRGWTLHRGWQLIKSGIPPLFLVYLPLSRDAGSLRGSSSKKVKCCRIQRSRTKYNRFCNELARRGQAMPMAPWRQATPVKCGIGDQSAAIPVSACKNSMKTDDLGDAFLISR